MRLLKLDSPGKLSLTKDLLDDIPPYAILSHTWGADEDEVTFSDLENGSGKSKAGYAKLRFCGEQARKEGIEYFWVDTCCINKASHVELSEAITSMFRWYRDAVRCYVYLSDVSARKRDNNGQSQWTWESAFRTSRWYTRGWTLQELLAPNPVDFFSREGELLGSKMMLTRLIHEITDIPITALLGAPLSDFRSMNGCDGQRNARLRRKRTRRTVYRGFLTSASGHLTTNQITSIDESSLTDWCLAPAAAHTCRRHRVRLTLVGLCGEEVETDFSILFPTETC